MHKTGIEWTDYASNPLRAKRLDGIGRVGWHCEKISAGCANCYAQGINRRFGTGLGYTVLATDQIEVVVNEKEFTAWQKLLTPSRIFVGDMTDIFGPWVPFKVILQVWIAMAKAPQHQFQILTKRPKLMNKFINWFLPGCEASFSGANLPLKNVWLGVSAETQSTADERIPWLIKTNAAVRFISNEPALGPVDITPYLPNLDWVITGGESGRNARPMRPAWARSVRDQCQTAGVPFFFKQWGEWEPWCERDQEDIVRSFPQLTTSCFVAGPNKLGYFDDGQVMRHSGKKNIKAALDDREWRECPHAHKTQKVS